MKVNFINKSLLKEFFCVFSIVNLIITTLLIFVDIPDNKKLVSFLIFIMIIIGIYIFLLIRANTLKQIKLNINGSVLEVKEGNIFEESDLKVISFNEYFDTKVDNRIIAENTLNGKFIKEYVEDLNELDNIINEKLIPISINEQRSEGKCKKYELGTILEYNDFLLTAFSKFDENNRANLTLKEYLQFLMNFWNNLDIIYGNRSVNITIFGSGITRFTDLSYISEQELLETIIWSFKTSRIKFTYPSKITIIIPKGKIEKINLYKVKEMF